MAIKVILKTDREKSVLRRHPWIYSGAVAEVLGHPTSGDTVHVHSAKGDFLCTGAYSPHSQIRVRIWSWDEQEVIDRSFFQRKIANALALRQAMPNLKEVEALRLVHGESDNIPGLIVDRYNEWLVAQFLSCGAEFWRDTILDTLSEIVPSKGIFERSDVEVRSLEGLEERSGGARGQEPPERIQIREEGLSFWVDIRRGQKTGFYLDQRDNRWHIRQLAENRDVLDCFCYTGGFSLSALAGGAKSVVAVDSSPEALAVFSDNIQSNGWSDAPVEIVEGNVFHVLRRFRDMGRNFDMVILDPPKFAATAAQVEQAARGYKDINLLAFKLLRHGGLLATFSCSGGLSPELHQKIVADAALDAGCEAQIVKRLSQAPDHPVGLNFPEGAYLKGLVVYKKTAEG